MRMKVSLNGFDDLNEKLKSAAPGKTRLTDLLNDDFMKENTKFDSLDAFAEASPFNWDTQEDFESIPEDELDKFVDENTDFSSWHEMATEAAKLIVLKNLGL